MRHKSYSCPVCGYPELRDPPRSKAGGGSYETCPSCRFEYGYTDDALHFTYEQWRQKWIDGGMVWDKGSSKPPAGWNPKTQLLNLIGGKG